MIRQGDSENPFTRAFQAIKSAKDVFEAIGAIKAAYGVNGLDHVTYDLLPNLPSFI